jgi:3-hydroxyanthranilate 3,4-dioxygenase
MAIAQPFNLNKWIENRHLLQPPVGNKICTRIWNYIVMLVAGQMPVKTTITTKQKNFYQLEGSIKIVIQEEGVRKEMELHAGDMYLHPANVHSSAFSGFNRFSNRTQTSGERIYGRLLWHCDNCNHKLYEVKFELKDIEKISCRILNISITQLP